MKDFVVIYHADCVDGFTAAWIAHRVFGETADYLPFKYGEDPPDFQGNEKVYILDFSFPRDVLLKIKKEVQVLVVLDHHKTAKNELEGLDFCIFDMNKCGARMTWEYFYPKESWDEEIEAPPSLVIYVEDQDLWKENYSKEISAAIQSYDFTWKNWDQLASWLSDTMQRMNVIGQGEAILRYQEQSIKKHMSRAWIETLSDFSIPVVNCTDKSIVSELGHRMAEKEVFSAIFVDTKDVRTWSLRSQESGRDVSEVAKRLGGGGHKHAAGFKEKI